MIAAHVDAVLARLREDPELASRVFEGEVSTLDGKPRTRYIRVQANGGFYEAERLGLAQSRVTFTFIIHSVSINPVAARQLQELVHAQLLGFRPSVVGRKCWPIRHEVSRPVQSDQDVSPPLWYTVDQFDLQSTTA